MSHNNQPEYFTINSICPHTGDVTSIGIFEDMDAVAWRLKRMYTSCGDEYRIECHHLSNAKAECEAWTEQQSSRAEYKMKEEEKEKKLKEYDEWKGQIKADNASVDIELPDIKAAYKTVGVSAGKKIY